MIKPTLKVRDDNLIYILVTQLASIIKWDLKEKLDIFAFIVSCNNQDHKPENSTFKAEINIFQILAISIEETNIKNLAKFLLIVLLNIQELETYKQAMGKIHAN